MVCVCAQSCPALCNPLGYSSPGIALGFPRQEYWSDLPFSTAGNLPEPGIELASPASPALQANSLPTEPWGKPVIYASLIVLILHFLSVPTLGSFCCLHEVKSSL